MLLQIKVPDNKKDIFRPELLLFGNDCSLIPHFHSGQ